MVKRYHVKEKWNNCETCWLLLFTSSCTFVRSFVQFNQPLQWSIFYLVFLVVHGPKKWDYWCRTTALKKKTKKHVYTKPKCNIHFTKKPNTFRSLWILLFFLCFLFFWCVSTFSTSQCSYTISSIIHAVLAT